MVSVSATIAFAFKFTAPKYRALRPISRLMTITPSIFNFHMERQYAAKFSLVEHETLNGLRIRLLFSPGYQLNPYEPLE